MLIPKKSRNEIYRYLFKEGVIVAKKDYNAPRHQALSSVKNLHVIKLLQSMKSRGYVTETFSWQWYYYYLTNEGINFLRDYLHLSEDVVPNTLKKARTSSRPGGFGRDRGDRPRGGFGRDDKKVGPGGEFKPSFRGEGRSGGRGFGGPRGGFGRGAGAPPS